MTPDDVAFVVLTAFLVLFGFIAFYGFLYCIVSFTQSVIEDFETRKALR